MVGAWWFIVMVWSVLFALLSILAFWHPELDAPLRGLNHNISSILIGLAFMWKLWNAFLRPTLRELVN